jgi:hypothetical protein
VALLTGRQSMRLRLPNSTGRRMSVWYSTAARSRFTTSERYEVRLRSPDLLLVLVVTAAAFIIGLTPAADSILRFVVGVPLVLFLPGYAISVAVVPDKALGEAERLVLSTGLSVSVAALGGLVLHWVPWGLDTGSWNVFLGGLAVVASLLAFERRARLARSNGERAAGLDGGSGPALRLHQRFLVRAGLVQIGRPAPGRALPRFREASLFALAALLGSLAFWASSVRASHQVEGFTQLWILPAEHGLDDRVRIGVRSMELDQQEYGLRLLADGTAVIESRGVRLEPGQTWETVARLSSALSDSNLIEAEVYRESNPDVPYRRVVLRRAGAGE